MKRHILSFLFILSAIGIITGCSTLSKKDTEYAEFRSNDLSTFFLRGPVMSVERWDKFSNEYVNDLSFDKNGNLVRFGDSTAYVNRDEQGRIIALSNYLPTEYLMDSHWDYVYSYTPDGNVDMCEGGAYWCQIVSIFSDHDNNGNPMKETVSMEDDEGNSSVENYTYEYIQFDDFGNWTARKVGSHTTRNYDLNTGDRIKESDKTDNFIEHRRITYYTRDQFLKK